MTVTRISSKGQVVIPKALRVAHAWEEGTELLVVDMGDGLLLKPVRDFPEAALDEVAGCLHTHRARVSLEAMDKAIIKAVRERHDRD